MSAFQASGEFLRIRPNETLAQLPTALAQSVPKFRENLHAVHAQFIGQLDNRAESIFNASIIRRGERGQGKGGTRDRQTGNFTFGGKSSAFVGILMEKGSRVGFGWPDIDRADAATNRVWRALEFGLSGKRHLPSSKIIDSSVWAGGIHVLPRAFHFEPGQGPATDRLIPTAGGYRQASQSPQRIARRKSWGGEKSTLGMTMGEGFEGKHFIENAWIEMKVGDARRYRPVVQKSFAAFR